MKQILVVHGPNLDLLGTREPEFYGSETLELLNEQLVAEGTQLGMDLECFQSNHEGVLIDRLHQARSDMDGIVINPAGLTHTSVSLRDAVAAMEIPVIEVHLSNIFAREEFRQTDLIAPVCDGFVAGMGAVSYLAALKAMAGLLDGHLS